MRRREFLSVLSAVMLAVPFAAYAQKQIPVIAILGSGAVGDSSSKMQMSLLEAGLRELGFVQGQAYAFETRWADSDSSRFRTLSAELLEHRPSAVVVSTNLAAIAVRNLSRTVPIVGTGLNDPVGAGLVASLARPGGNVTGVSTMAEDLLLKLIEIMRETLPEVRSVTVMTNPTNPSNQPMVDMLSRHVANTALSIGTVNVSSPADIDAAFAELSRQRPGALFVLTDNSLLGLSEKIIARALAQRVPTFGNFADSFARAGALFAYSRDPKEAFQGVARLLTKILNGVTPADLPLEQPTKFNLIINLNTAKALGIDIPPKLLTRADQVIE